VSWRHRWLLASFARREVLNRYAGSAAGLGWALIHPLALLAVYAFVFSSVFRVALPPEAGSASYIAFVAVTLWPWLMFADALDRGTAAVQANADLVRKVAFPHRLLVEAAVLASFAVHAVGYLAVLLILRALGEPILLSGLPWALVLIALLALGTIGLAAFLATLQVLLRDVQQVVAVLMTLLFYATPVLYPASLVPERFRSWLHANPLAWLVERLREVMLAGAGPSPVDLGIAVGALTSLAAGLWVFHRVSPYFEDYL
jgi:ABC-type polysaccharide/polyol phosphate export permease